MSVSLNHHIKMKKKFLFERFMYQSNRSLNITPPPPPGIPRAFDVFSCLGGREFDELSLPGVGHLIAAHRGGEFDH